MAQQIAQTTEEHGLLSDNAYQKTDLFADVIMKGGITSGVVYPLAVCELARTYQLKSIGGASAGAIAAAGAAAAELGRQRLRLLDAAAPARDETAGSAVPAANGQPRWRQGYAGLAQLPTWIGVGNTLLSLFQPQPETRSLFRLLIAGIGDNDGRLWRIVKTAVREYPGNTVLGLIPALFLLLSAIGLAVSDIVAGGFLAIGSLICAVLLAIIGPVLTVGLSILRAAAIELPKNRFGICSGLEPEQGGQTEALTTWMTHYFDRLAGKPPGDHPLTFGELWAPPDAKPEERSKDRLPLERNINLETITTSLTLGRPFRLPFDSQRFYFKKSDFDDLFPKEVVQWMVDHPGERPPRSNMAQRDDLHRMPKAAELPVVVAARMSLSFPLLFSAVPLYGIDYNRPKADKDRESEPCWFSDGGITSNLPVHFFDSPLPRWPTFAINLRSFEVDVVRDDKDQRNNVYFPKDNNQGLLETWSRYERPADAPPPKQSVRAKTPGALSRIGQRVVTLFIPPLDPLIAFVSSIIDTMQNWTDNAQIRQPGHRDRTIHIRLDDSEGGINLNMPPDTTVVLSERGRHAGVMLRERFAEPPQEPGAQSWDNHRWIRYRSWIAAFEQLLVAYRRGSTEPLNADRTYADLIARDENVAPTSYPWTGAEQQQLAERVTGELLELAESWQAAGQHLSEEAPNLSKEAPNPRSDLRLVPRL